MHKNSNLVINEFQLNVLIDEKQKQIFKYILDNGVYCTTCGDNCKKGVRVNEIQLTSLNDIMIRGNCNKCNGEFARIFEFGEDREFYKKADNFRESIKNK